MTWSDEPRAAPEPGWYRDPAGSGGLRYWDGRTWTGYVTDPPVAAAAPAATVGGPAAPPLAPAPPLAAGPTTKTPAWIWVLLACTLLLLGTSVVAAVAVPAFHAARDVVWDEEAKSLLTDTRPIVQGLAVADGAYTALSTDRLQRNDPFHAYTEGASTGPNQLSVDGREDGFALALRSRSGRCWVVDTRGPLLAGSRDVRTGRLAEGRSCQATAAGDLDEEEF